MASSGEDLNRIQVKVRAELLDETELQAVERSASNLMHLVRSSGSGPRSLGEAVWPAFFLPDRAPNVELTLIPLSRLGAAQGFSGNHVTIGYFIDVSEGARVIPSRPMVVKVSPTNRTAKLAEERDNAEKVRLHAAYSPGSFATPIHHEEIDGYGILWSPFSSNKPILEAYSHETGSRLSLGIDDLWNHLRTAEPGSAQPRLKAEEICKILAAVFQLLKPFHLKCGLSKVENRSLLKEYERNLRGFASKWGTEWRDVWAPETERNVVVGGVTRANPLWVLAKLNACSMSFFCGAVHGDLHPRNIVLSEGDVPHIIDFGWSGDSDHIAKDFVLLECNFRFVLLRPDLMESDTRALAKWISMDAAQPDLVNSYCSDRLKLILKVRQLARETFPRGTDWDRQYVIPMFLVALGLLKFYHEMQNQHSAMLTILELADYITARVIPSDGERK